MISNLAELAESVTEMSSKMCDRKSLCQSFTILTHTERERECVCAQLESHEKNSGTSEEIMCEKDKKTKQEEKKSKSKKDIPLFSDKNLPMSRQNKVSTYTRQRERERRGENKVKTNNRVQWKRAV